MNKVDLHIHSVHSDGSMNIDEVFRSAKEEGMTRVAITDHDALPPWDEVKAARDRYRVDAVTGVELSCQDPLTGRSVHLLGYGFRPSAPHIRAFCEEMGILRREQNTRQLAILKEMGYEFACEKLMEYMGPWGVLQKQHILRLLMDAGYTDHMYSSLFFELFGRGGILLEADESPGYEEGMSAILADGGIVSLAHPGLSEIWDLVPTLKDLGLSALEMDHPVHSKEQQERARQLAEKYDLQLSGGSDTHGTYGYIHRRIGEHLSHWLTHDNPSERMYFVRRLLERASKEALALSRRPLSSWDKGKYDWVCEVDFSIQKLILDEITRQYPGETLISEEMPEADFSEGSTWVLDPIDGTRNLLYERENFFISLALYEGKHAVLAGLADPYKSELFLGEKSKGVMKNGLPLPKLSSVSLEDALLENGTRNGLSQKILSSVQAIRYSGSIAKSLSMLLSGKRHLLISDKVKIWDIAGGVFLLEELGGAAKVFPGKGRGGADMLVAAVSRELLEEALAAL
ncbi:MAG TPA: PHP domain-containing protein [Tissierellia bacterium]|jgi:fructose-1,6-bisphosphatase/inositol monophosphatase family enzyme/predicted metal-dependent phosphoesterase TrpH|nr:PHP domain-containing protein [Tissierellia bacterium]